MAYAMNIAKILKNWLERKNSIDFLHSRNISRYPITFNKYMAREARVMRKMLGYKTERCVSYCCVVCHQIFGTMIISHNCRGVYCGDDGGSRPTQLGSSGPLQQDYTAL
jgi:hypothetical protein